MPINNLKRWIVRAGMRAILALALTGLIVYLIVVEREMPEWLIGVYSSIVGYFFASEENNARRHPE